MNPVERELFHAAAGDLGVVGISMMEFRQLPEAEQARIAQKLNVAARYAGLVVRLQERKRDAARQDLRRFVSSRPNDDDALREYQERRRAEDEQRRISDARP
jgi:hypothetical protein